MNHYIGILKNSALNFALRIIKFSKSVEPVKYFTVFCLGFAMLFRFCGYSSGGSSEYIRTGDADGNGIITFADIISLAGRTGEGAEENLRCDMNGDGKINRADLFSLIRFWGDGSDEIVYADKVNLSADAVTLYIGNQNQTARLTASVLPEDAAVKDVIWQSSDEGVVTVSDGLLTAKGAGEAVVTAVSADGFASAQCVVAVGIGVTGVEFDPNEIYIYENSPSFRLVPVIYPENASARTLVWQSSDWNVVGVDSAGGITPVGVGTAVIGASSAEGNVTAACTVHVVEEPWAEAENAPDISTQRTMKTGSFTNYLPISRSFNSMLDIQCGLYNIISVDGFSTASASDVAKYANPSNYCEGTAKYQFLDLSVPNNMTAEALNVYLKNKGILTGMGQVYIDAANEYGVSEAYLVAHSCLETGNGSSRLAKGVEYNGVTVYNMFGIGAYDGNALMGGAAYAYKQGWTSPEAAIRGGAKWIAENYIYRAKGRQNTLYKMRWNPLSPGVHQYATDVTWAVSQAYTISKIIGGAQCLQIFEIPVYSGEYTGYIPDVSPKTTPDYYSVSMPAAEPEPEAEAQTEDAPNETVTEADSVLSPTTADAEVEAEQASQERPAPEQEAETSPSEDKQPENTRPEESKNEAEESPAAEEAQASSDTASSDTAPPEGSSSEESLSDGVNP